MKEWWDSVRALWVKLRGCLRAISCRLGYHSWKSWQPLLLKDPTKPHRACQWCLRIEVLHQYGDDMFWISPKHLNPEPLDFSKM
jgi:hypothetical protein